MEEMLIIPRAEAPELVQKHSALLMEDGRLSHAVRLAARQERLLTDPTLPDDVAVEQVKPVDRKLRPAVKKLRQLQTQPLTAEEEAQEGQELLIVNGCDVWCERCNPMEQRPPTSPRLDVGVDFYPLLRQTPLGEARRLRLKKKEYTRSLYARGTEGCTLETHPSQKEDPYFNGSASFEIGHHPRIVGESKCSIEKGGTTSYDSSDESLYGQSVA